MPFPGRVVRVSPDQQLESGLVFFHTGDQYRQAAIRCGGEFQDPVVLLNNAEEWALLHDPVCNLAGHALELYLKAYLLAKGRSAKELARRPFGHNLVELCLASQNEGLVLSPESVDAIASLSRDYGEAPYVFRYPVVGKRRLNILEGLVELMDEMRQATFPSVNKRARSLGTPVEE